MLRFAGLALCSAVVLQACKLGQAVETAAVVKDDNVSGNVIEVPRGSGIRLSSTGAAESLSQPCVEEAPAGGASFRLQSEESGAQPDDGGAAERVPSAADRGPGAEDLPPATLGQMILAEENDLSTEQAGLSLNGAGLRRSITLVTSRAEVSSATSTNAELGLSLGPVSLSASADASRSMQNVDSESHLVVKAVDKGGLEELLRPRLTAFGREKLQAGQAEFDRYCGNRYLASVRRGRVFFGVVAIRGTTNAASSQTSIQAAVQAWRGSARGSRSWSSSLTSAFSATRAEIFTQPRQTGSFNTIEAMLETLAAWENSDGAGIPLVGIAKDYNAVDGYNGNLRVAPAFREAIVNGRHQEMTFEDAVAHCSTIDTTQRYTVPTHDQLGAVWMTNPQGTLQNDFWFWATDCVTAEGVRSARCGYTRRHGNGYIWASTSAADVRKLVCVAVR